MMNRSDAEVPVGVVIPMYNAEATIAETLESICGQTYRALEIIVVDDGSTDGCRDIVAAYAERDGRIRLVHQANAGVAGARNQGAIETSSDYLAFVDADDLWAPEKIAAQMELLAGRKPALVYCWFSHIDERSRVYPVNYEYPAIEGDVRQQLARKNFVGNGSSMLVPREVFESTGGFDPGLRERSAQGCEDYMFAMAVAQHYPFRVVPRRLVGYRSTLHNMSSDPESMMRSYEIVVERFRSALPEYEVEFVEHHRDFLRWHAYRAVVDGRFHHARAMVRRLRIEHHIGLPALAADLALPYLKARIKPRWAKLLAARLGLISRPRYQDGRW